MAVRDPVRLPAFVACVAVLLAPSMPAVAQETWRQAVDRLGQEKTLAEGCASILKACADDAPMARAQGQRLYARARADVDGLIVLLTVDLAGGSSPAAVPELRQRLEAVVEQRQSLCRHVDATVKTALRLHGEGTSAADLLAEGNGGAPGSLIDAAVQIWQAYRRADRAGRESIVAKLEDTRWRDYAEVPENEPGRPPSAADAQPCAPNSPRGRQNRTPAISR